MLFPNPQEEYRLIAQGKPVEDAEVESAAEGAVVRTYWGRNLIQIDHLTPTRDYVVGESKEDGGSCDFEVPAIKLGAARLQLIVDGAVFVPCGAQGTVEVAGQPAVAINEAIEAGLAMSTEGGHRVPLVYGTVVRIEVEDMAFEVGAVRGGKKLGLGIGLTALASGSALYVLGSFLGHVGVLFGMAMFTPPLGDTTDDGVTDEQRYLMQQYLDSAAEKELLKEEVELADNEDAANTEGGTGTAAAGASGEMGNPTSKATGSSYGNKGPADNPDPRIARQVALQDAATFGLIGLLGGDPDTPTAVWGADDSLGTDPLSARGNMWGKTIGDSFGAGGLGLTGIGESGGGRGEGIGMGNVGGLGHGDGIGDGHGIGSGNGRPGKSHRPRPPRIRTSTTTVSGRLPPEVIQRIVRQNFGRFRLCYENGLRTNPTLEGRVSVNFVIGRDGRVSNVGAAGLGDVGSCVGRAFYGLSFPQPEAGIVTVNYPILFQPGG